MHPETKSTLIEQGMGLAATLSKEMFVRRQEQQQMERRMELEKEIEEAKARSQAAGQIESESPGSEDADSADDSVVASLTRATELAAEYDDLLTRAEEAEECDLCKQLIAAARDEPLSHQREILPQLREFIAATEQGADSEELQAHLEDAPELLRLIQESAVGESRRQRDQGRERSPPPGQSDTDGAYQQRF